MFLSAESGRGRAAWPRYVEIHDPPFPPRRASEHRTYGWFCAAMLPVIGAGTYLVGYGVLGIYAAAMAGALVASKLCDRFAAAPGAKSMAHAICVGLMLALTLPPTVGWVAPFLGAFAGIAICRSLLGGLGNYLWNPALVGRTVVQLAFSDGLMPLRWSFLGAGHGLTGSLNAASAGLGYRGFDLTYPPPGVEAWSLARPIDWLVGQCGFSVAATQPGPSLLSVFRDCLPPWRDTLWGVVGGGIGETCFLAVVAGGLVLICLRCSRWQLPVAAFGTVALLSAVWPIRIDAGQPAAWCPILAVREGFPVGAALVLFQLTGGGLAAASLLIAPDPASTPLTGRGHLLFGVGLGALTFLARVSGLSPGSAYWAVLAMNTLVPLIDRVTRRQVFGTSR